GRILLRTIDRQDFNVRLLAQFWVRRWCRTLPNYLLVLSFLVIVALAIPISRDRPRASEGCYPSPPRLRRVAQLRRSQRIREQCRDGHRAHAARHGRDPARSLFRGLEFHVAAEPSRGIAVHADVDDDGAGLDPVASHELGLADGGDQ